MKKLIVVLIAAFIGVLAAPAAHAQTPEECAESDTAPPGCPPDGNYPPAVLPPTVPASTLAPAPVTSTTTTVVAVAPPPPQAPLPATGSSGFSGVLGIGALFVTGGLVVLVAARRRSTASEATT